MRRVAVIATTSGNGKTTVGRRLADRLDVQFVELDALVHGPGWTEVSNEELRAILEPIVQQDGWVIDGGYRRKIGDLVLAKADTVVWLDLPVRVWLPRLLGRTLCRIRGRETLWNDNRESLRSAFWGRESLFGYALRMHVDRRRRYPQELAAFPVIRLRTQREIDEFVRGAGGT